MTDTQFQKGSIRKLCGGKEAQKFRDHLLRLDKVNQTMRFGLGVTAEFITYYADQALKEDHLAFGYVEDGEIRASGELILMAASDPLTASIALSVEPDFQGQGIASELMRYLIETARNEGFRKLEIKCLAENEKMQHICRKHQAILHFQYGEVTADILPEASLRERQTEKSESTVSYAA